MPTSTSSLGHDLRLLDAYDAEVRKEGPDAAQLTAQLTSLLKEQGTPGHPVLVEHAVQAFLATRSDSVTPSAVNVVSPPSSEAPITWWRPESSASLQAYRQRFEHVQSQFIAWSIGLGLGGIYLMETIAAPLRRAEWFQVHLAAHPGIGILSGFLLLLGVSVPFMAWFQFKSPLRHAFALAERMRMKGEDGGPSLDLLSQAERRLQECVPTADQLTRWMASPINRSRLVALSQSDVPLLRLDVQHLEAHQDPATAPLCRQHAAQTWSQLRQELRNCAPSGPAP